MKGQNLRQLEDRAMNHPQQTRPEQQQQPLAEMVAVASSNQHVDAYPDPTHQLSHQQPQPFHDHHQQLQSFWANQLREVELTTDFKNHSLPLARIKKIMKADEEVRMISAEAPVVFAKACEMFILELTLRSWMHTEENKRRTLQRNDIVVATSRGDIFDFLVDIIPRDELKDEFVGMTKASIPFMRSPGDSIPYYHVPQAQLAHPGSPSGMMMAKPMEQSALFVGQQLQTPLALAFVPWTQPITTSTITSDTQAQTGHSQHTTTSKETG